MRLIIFFIFTICSINIYAINEYKIGDNLSVWAKNGLNIRKEPNLKSLIIGKLNFGAQVIIIDENIKAMPFSSEVAKIKELDKNNDNKEVIKERRKSKKKLIINGFWVKIKINNLEGYVFDAYLSSLKIPNNKNTLSKGEDYDSDVELLKLNFGLLKKKGINLYNKNNKKDVSFYFNKGAEIHIGGGLDHWGKNIILPYNISLIEGYLIYETRMKDDNDIIIFISDNKIIIEIIDGEISIEIIKGKLVISEDHAC